MADEMTDDLDSEDDASTSTTDKGDKGSGVRGQTRGICKVCGDPAYSPLALYCEEHRGQAAGSLRQDGRPRSSAGKMPVKAAQQLETDLRTNLEMVGQVWAMRDPFCGHVLCPKDYHITVAVPPEVLAAAGLRHGVDPDTQMPYVLGAGASADIAKYWVGQAQTNPYVRSAVEAVGSGGGLAGAVLAGFAVHRPLLMALFTHHIAPALAARRAVDVQSQVRDEEVSPLDDAAQAAARAAASDPDAAEEVFEHLRADVGDTATSPWLDGNPQTTDDEDGGGGIAAA